MRLMLTDSMLPEYLDQNEKEIFKAIMLRKLSNKNMGDEGGTHILDAMHDYADGLTDAQVIALGAVTW